MKKFNTNRLRAFFMALLLILTSTVHTSAFAKSDVTWTEDDFMYSSEGNIIAFSDKGLEKKEKTNILVFPEGTKSINGNYSLSHSNDELRYKKRIWTWQTLG